MKPPPNGHVFEIDEDDASFDALGALIGFDFEEDLDEPDCMTGEVWPFVVIGGDVTVDGDVISKELPVGREGFTGKEEGGFVVVVLGNLVVKGHLEVEQYYTLIVAGDVDAHSYFSHSANFVCTGTVRARDLILTEANEEGGLFVARAASAAAWVSTGHYYDDEVPFEGVEIGGDQYNGEDYDRALNAAFVALDKPLDDDDLWEAVSTCLTTGVFDDFLEAYENEERAEAAPAQANPSAKTPAVQPETDSTDAGPLRRVCHLDRPDSYAFVTGFWSHEDEVLAVGGLQGEVAFRSTDAGRSFSRFEIAANGRGLRDIHRAGTALWICGTYGLLARSTDGGKTFEVVDLEVRPCFQTLLEADGALWVTGDPGAYRSTDGGETWAKVTELEGEITRPQDSEHGVLLPSDRGFLYLCKEGVITKTGLEATGSPWAATCTKEGTILVVCSEGKVHRSTDGGASFSFVQTAAPKSLQNIVALDDGHILTVGESGAFLESSDDGLSFTVLDQPFTNNWVFGLHKYTATSALVGCQNGVILEYRRTAK